MTKRPAFQFYPGDWLEEKGLRASSLAARGLWIDLMCFMHQGVPYGHLRNETGHALTVQEIARAVGDGVSKVKALLDELVRHNVPSVTDDGVLYSRRMVRDEAVRMVRAEGGVSAAKNPNASRPGDKRQGGRPRGSEGVTEGVPEGGSERGFGGNPPSSPSSSSERITPLPPADSSEPIRPGRDADGTPPPQVPPPPPPPPGTPVGVSRSGRVVRQSDPVESIPCGKCGRSGALTLVEQETEYHGPTYRCRNLGRYASIGCGELWYAGDKPEPGAA